VGGVIGGLKQTGPNSWSTALSRNIPTNTYSPPKREASYTQTI